MMFVLILFKTSSLISCSFRDILNTLPHNHILKASSLLDVALVSVHVSAPYTSVEHIRRFTMRDFNSMLMFLDVRIVGRLSNAVLAISILQHVLKNA